MALNSDADGSVGLCQCNAEKPLEADFSEIVDDAEFERRFEIQKCISWIAQNNFKRVALQFPDSLIHVADKIALKLQNNIAPALIYILADTSYGSCCVDEVTAEHVCSDSIVHYGLACLTPCNRLPVLYIFGKDPIDPQEASREIQNLTLNKLANILLFSDVTYEYASELLYQILAREYPNIIRPELLIPGSSNTTKAASDGHDFIICGRRFHLKNGVTINDYSVLFIGTEGHTLTQLLMTMNKCDFYSYDPVKKVARQEGICVNKALQKRYFAVEKARDAQIVGILMGTLGISNFLDVVDRLKSVAKYAGKKTYTISVGRLNPTKLANFPEIDVFVLVACPENSVSDFKEYYRPIITPFEFELACLEERQWTGEYITDFHELMEGSQHYVAIPETNDNQSRTTVSLISGQLKTLSAYKATNDWSDRRLLPKDSLLVSEIHDQGGGEFLMKRSWQGLKLSLEDTTPAVIQEGNQGTASAYTREKVLLDTTSDTL